ncbi:TPA: hypothetical protein OMT82_000394 [Enterobacter cloacae]|nr:hypothetical protein [Enterobacter cloacae]HCR0905042.1 hypothetical protein [Enterobacter cloacae]
MINYEKMQEIAEIYVANYSNGSRVNVNGTDIEFIKGGTKTSYYAVHKGIKYLPAIKFNKPIDQLLVQELYSTLCEKLPKLTASKPHNVDLGQLENIDIGFQKVMMFLDTNVSKHELVVSLDQTVYFKLDLNDGDLSVSISDKNTVSKERMTRAANALHDFYTVYKQ